MKNNPIDYYVWNILRKQLQKFKISNTALYNIVDNVKEQLNSLISNWNDIEFRDSILILGSEEGNFYEPKNGQIANMVVVTIRNSLLEGVSSKSYLEYGSSVYLDDSSIKIITSEAIEYFSKINLEQLATQIKPDYDFYREISSKYKVAMKSLVELSKCNNGKREHKYEPVKIDKPYEIEELEQNKSKVMEIKNYESGISEKFNSSLCNYLEGIKNKESSVFVTDCFKMTTRNFEKILRVLEFILTHNAKFITCNYLITNSYVSRREKLLRASHTTDEFFYKLKYLPEISEEYKDLLEKISMSMQN